MRDIAEDQTETETWLAFPQSFGADRIPGYYHSRPLAVADFEDFVATYGAQAFAGQP